MSTILRDLAASTRYRRFSSEADLDDFIRERFPRASAEERIAMKLDLTARGKFSLAGQGLATDQDYAPGTLSTDLARDTPETPPVGREMASLLRKTGLSVDRSYRDSEVSEALDGSGLDTMSRIAVRHLLGERGCLRKG